ncbi:hypothetical protein E2562_007414 [Oryza meyeriana var. granulata]|uniref:Uncharacterized protein n=1 Tax=Oryza meyeriana var. granulata TaxID=110450 RepID=A0A6G1CZQ5_9ORYZ|nr:hypothetical protein E2562_007414 [Oryza meyeriana var. granulata]
MGPRLPSGSATNGEPNIFDNLAGAEAVGADVRVLLKALEKLRANLVAKMEKVSTDDSQKEAGGRKLSALPKASHARGEALVATHVEYYTALCGVNPACAWPD